MDYKTVKLDFAGNTEWIKTYNNGSANDTDYANSVTVDFNGNVFVTGESKNGSGNYDYCTIKYDSDGTQQWVMRYHNTSHDRAKKICVDAEGNSYITGESYNGNNYDFRTIAYDTSGTELWNKTFNGHYNGNDRGMDIEERSGIVYVSGFSWTGAAYEYITIAYGQAEFSQFDDVFNEEKGSNFWFWPNEGQLLNDSGTVANVEYYNLYHYPALFFNDAGTSYVFYKAGIDSLNSDTMRRVEMNFIHRDSLVENKIFPGNKSSNYYINYYLPQCGPNGITNSFGVDVLIHNDVYQGISVCHTSNETGHKYFIVAKPNSKPDEIRLQFSGADSLVSDTGEYKIYTEQGIVSYNRLIAYEVDANGTFVPGTTHGLRLIQDTSGYYYFDLAAYNNSNTLVISASRSTLNIVPQNYYNIGWCTYWGSWGYEEFNEVKTHGQGFTLSGNTSSLIFPLAAGISYTGQSSNAGATDIVCINLNNNIEPKWLCFFGGSSDDFCNAADTRANGNLVCGGQTLSYDLPLLTPGNALRDSLTSPEPCWLIAEFDPSGYLVWSTVYSKAERIYDVKVSDSNSGERIYFVGKGYGNADTIQLPGSYIHSSYHDPDHWCSSYAMAFDSVRTPIWATFIFGVEGSATALQTNQFNQLYMVGYFDQIAPEINSNLPDTATNPNWHPNTDAWVSIFNKNTLSQNSLLTIITDESEMFNDVIVNNEGNAIALGSQELFYNCIDYDTSSTIDFFDPAANNMDGLILMCDTSGDMKWYTYFGNEGWDEIRKGEVDESGNIFITGVTESANLPVPPVQPPNFYVQPSINDLNASFKDAFIAQFDANCEFIWSTYFGTKNSDVNDRINAMLIKDSRLFFCGGVDGGGEFDSTSIYRQRYDWNSNYNDYYQHLSNSPNSPEAFAGFFDTLYVSGLGPEKARKIQNKMVLYPNPASDFVSIKYYNSKHEQTEVSIYSMTGELMVFRHLPLPPGQHHIRFNLENFSSGIYLVKLQSHSGHETAKFIKH